MKQKEPKLHPGNAHLQILMKSYMSGEVGTQLKLPLTIAVSKLSRILNELWLLLLQDIM